MIQDPSVEVLLIEDNASDVELIVRALKKNLNPLNICVFSDGVEALEYFFCKGKYACRDNNSFPKLVLLDLKLPKINGLEILRIVKSDQKTRSIPVVILTSSKEESDIVSGYNLGANSFIVKPVNYDEFMSTIGVVCKYWIELNEPPVQ